MYYTKYRPQKFSEISKPNDTAVALANQVRNKKTVHAYLFVGPRGVGKTTTARILAKALNCGKVDKEGNPCGKCSVCESVRLGSFVDLIEIDAASNRGIDDIRALRERVKLAPTTGENKVYIIDEVHMLTKEAFNALLKTLEEPPRRTVFILCTTELHKVPDTIKSRCQVFKFKRATKAQLVQKLEDICVAEGVSDLKKGDLEKIAEASFGGFRDAETVLQQVVEGNLDPEAFVGLSSQQLYIDFVDSLLSKDTNMALRQVNKLVEDGYDLNVWVLDLLSYLRDLLFISADAHEGLIDVGKDHFKMMESQANLASEHEIMAMIEAFVVAGNEINEAMIPHLPVELAVVKLTSGSGGSGGDSVTDDDPDSEYMDEDIEEEPSIPISRSKKLTNKTPDKKKKNKSTRSKATKSSDVTVAELEKTWPEIVKKTIEYNHSIHALLKRSRPIEVKGKLLVLEVNYAFHKERLESPKNRRIVEAVIEDVLDRRMRFKCKVCKKEDRRTISKANELTDYNIAVPALSGDSLTDIFDGGLPL